MKITGRIEDRFYSKIRVNLNTGCWIWQDAPDNKGYGRLKINYSYVRSHTLSYLIHIGQLPDKKQVLHTCDIRLCVNPQHIYAGTHMNNIKDRMARNTQPKTLTHEDILDIKKRLKNGGSITAISKIYNVSPACIHNISTRRTWSHVT